MDDQIKATLGVNDLGMDVHNKVIAQVGGVDAYNRMAVNDPTALLPYYRPYLQERAAKLGLPSDSLDKALLTTEGRDAVRTEGKQTLDQAKEDNAKAVTTANAGNE